MYTTPLITRSMTTVECAETIARVAHLGQKRKYEESELDYFVHPFRVAERANRAGMSKTVTSAALLHDVMEDCDEKYRNDIADHCGAEVFVLVYELTNPSKKLFSKRALRKEIDRAHLANVSLDAVRIKLIDRADNLLHMLQAPSDFKRLYLEESGALYHILTDRIAKSDDSTSHVLIEEYRASMKVLRETIK